MKRIFTTIISLLFALSSHATTIDGSSAAASSFSTATDVGRMVLSSVANDAGGGPLPLGIALTGVGGATLRLQTGSFYGRYMMTTFLSAAAINSGTGVTQTGANYSFTTGAFGQWTMLYRFGVPANLNSGNRMFCGIQDRIGAAWSPGVDPSTVTNTVYFGFDAADTDRIIRICSNTSTGTATCAAIGAAASSWDLSAGTPKAFELSIKNSANGTLSWTAKRIDTLDASGGDTVSGTVTLNLPDTGVSMLHQCELSTGTSAAAISFDFIGVYQIMNY